MWKARMMGASQTARRSWSCSWKGGIFNSTLYFELTDGGLTCWKNEQDQVKKAHPRGTMSVRESSWGGNVSARREIFGAGWTRSMTFHAFR